MNLSTLHEEFQKNAQQRADSYQKWIDKIAMERDLLEKAIAHLPDNLPEPRMLLWNSSGEPLFYYPYDRVLKTNLIQLMQNAGWEIARRLDEEDVDSWNYPSIQFRYAEEVVARVEMWFDETEEGSTCKRVQIGTRIIEKPIFEFACPDGAKEMAGDIDEGSQPE